MEKITLEIYPSFIEKDLLMISIKKHDKQFAKKLEGYEGSFVWNGDYFTNSMSGYLLRIPLDYKGNTVKYGKAISKDFNLLRDGI